ncbi:MAG TPA: FixH family protein [Arenimonas sp.]|nr:FixH family protein [Arenimonas sp.]
MTTSDATPRPAWRQPMFWLVLAIPLATLAAGWHLLGVAGGDRATDSTPDRVRRTAQVQVADLSADEAAAQRALSARVRVGSDGLRIDATTAETELRLQLVHPADSSLDRELTLTREGNGWLGEPLPDAGIAWHLRLQPVDGSWRLVGRWQPGHDSAELQPALSTR